jgi:eukaryotic-like serine/threonine-protein kinase
MDPATAARIVRDLADALGHAHNIGVVHRDIKPGNVIIDDRGRPRLIDFGLARRSDVDSDLTRDGVVVGTPAYMSPEQARGQGNEADERSDVYSLGVIFYGLLCGRRPHEARMEPGQATRQGSEQPAKVPSARSLNRAVPAALDAICTKAMSPRPADRYPSARALAEAVDAWTGKRRRRTHPVTLVAIALLLGVAMVMSATLSPRPGDRGESGAVAFGERLRTATASQSAASTRSTEIAVGPQWKAAEGSPVTGAVIRGPLVGNLNTKTYHTTNCRHTKTVPEVNRVDFQNPREARDRGYRPCKTCKPPDVESEPPTAPEK